MNILPKKSWHVRNKDNIARVRRDEENARKEEEERLRRVAVAEAEHRTLILKQQAQKRKRPDTNDDDINTDIQVDERPVANEHLNFFKHLEEGEKVLKGNKEYEKEKKEEQEKQEKAIGLLTFLGKSAIESQNETPWYQKAPIQLKLSEQSAEDIVRSEKSTKRKATMDPMLVMNHYLSEKKKADKIVEQSRMLAIQSGACPSTSKNVQVHEKFIEESPGERHKSKKKHKKDKKKKHKRKGHKDEESNLSQVAIVQKTSSKTIEELRAERLQREQAERQKTNALLAKLSGKTMPQEKAVEQVIEVDDRKRGYNSQFNPEFVRRPKRQSFQVDDFISKR